MADKAIVVGSGAGGSTAAMVLAEAGYDVIIFEKGPNNFGDLTSATPSTLFSNDELKSRRRGFATPDTEAEPRTFRQHAGDATMDPPGNVSHLPSLVGGGTVHWDAKTPRFWDIDFSKLEMMGRVEGADIRDWPFTYQDITPFYDEIEALIGVQGDVAQMPKDITLKHAPRSRQFVMPPGPPQRTSQLLADGAASLQLHPFPAPMAINSTPYDGRPACNNCGYCSHYGCPIHARVGALAPLRRALLAGAEVRPESFVFRVNRRGRRATGITYVDRRGRVRHESADVVVLAGSAIETIRLALLSQLPDPHGQIGRYLMFHWFTAGFGMWLTERLHGYKGRSTTHAADDFADPDFPGASAFARANGLPYIRGGTLELGGVMDVIEEAMLYKSTFVPVVSPGKPFGRAFKQLMRASLFRDHFAAIEMLAEDLPQWTNFVDLDPKVKDFRGYPVARITYAPHKHEVVAQEFYMPLLAALMKAGGADVVGATPETSAEESPLPDQLANSAVPDTKHIMGGMRMGNDPKTSVTNEHGLMHALDNVLVADGSVFVTSGAHNPTLTIMAAALRNARALAGAPRKKARVLGRKRTAPEDLPATGVGASAAAGGGLIATAAGLAATLKRHATVREDD